MKKFIISFVLLLVASFAFPQEFYPGMIRIIVNEHSTIPKDGVRSSNENFDLLLSQFEITDISQPLYFAITPELQKLYELHTSHDEDSLFDALKSLDAQEHLFISIEKCPMFYPLYDPGDEMWQNHRDWLWHLDNIDACHAWDITHGDTNVIVAIVDAPMVAGIDENHPDLVDKINPPYDFYANNSFSLHTTDPQHGTAVATLLAGETVDDGETGNGMLASIGYNTRVMYSNAGDASFASLYASTVLNADIITIVCASCRYMSYYEWIEQEILNNGTTIIRAAGNGINTCGGENVYPFSGKEDDRVIVVSSIGPDNKHKSTDFAESHSHYPEVDLCAPGYGIMAGTSTQNGNNPWPYYGNWSGTSFAAPITSGTAALMYAVNPCLSSNWTQDLLKNTTDAIADADLYVGLIGTGKLNAYKAVRAAQDAYSSSLDLYIKDRPEDFGYNGSYEWGWWFDNSPDIWVRNQPDGFTNQEHQDPIYDNSHPVYVYVRVWNKSCDPSHKLGNLSLYWSKASSCSSWPQNWDGTQPSVGNLIATQKIPYIYPGECKILEFEWNIANPYVLNNWSTCLLARIEDIPSDSIVTYPNHLEYDVYYNNNIALKNLTIININKYSKLPVIGDSYFPIGRFMFVGNGTDLGARFDIGFSISPSDSVKLTDKAEIHIFTDDAGWDYLHKALENCDNAKIVNKNEFIITGDQTVLHDIYFPPQTRIPIYIGFNFLTAKMDKNQLFSYTVYQNYSSKSNHITGAEHFIINLGEREPFHADAGQDQTINLNSATILTAKDITEDATYNWYDENHILLHSGIKFEVQPDNTSKFKLEVIAQNDGSKDYDEVNIIVKKMWIKEIIPNPTHSNTKINYVIEGANQSSLMILNAYGIAVDNYILQNNSSSIIIDVSNFIPGSYNIILVADGKAVDCKPMIVIN